MRKSFAILGSALFFCGRALRGGRAHPMVDHPLGVSAIVLWPGTDACIGVLLIFAGAPGLVDSFSRFAMQGLGTPVPIAPTQNLVVTGLYRYVRNPIYIAVVAVILGQAVLFGDWRLVLYAALFWLACRVFVVAYEEPTLARTFGGSMRPFEPMSRAGSRG